ncbi:MAG: hypothetical protein M1827_002766 [Pycnora praestabilis]|nr:MAG: hypothetical protein M1827_002766 [Pycnora praestabilis]
MESAVMLLGAAEDSQDVAAALNRFITAIPESSTDITAVISQLFGISSALRELHAIFDTRQSGRTAYVIADDLRLALRSLTLTLDAVHQSFGQLASFPALGAAAYRRVWTMIDLGFRREAGDNLCDRLEMYKVFINSLSDVLSGSSPGSRNIVVLRSNMLGLLESQEPPIELGFDRLSLGARAIPSYPRTPVAQPYEPEPLPRRRGSFHRRRPGSPISPQSPTFSDHDYSFPAPDVPTSPISTTFSAQSSSSNESPPHWASDVFDGRHSTTPFRVSSEQISECRGRDIRNAELDLSLEFKRVVDLSFDDKALIVRLYCRPSDHQAKILCISAPTRSDRPKIQSFSPLTSLNLVRTESCLKLFTPSQPQRPGSLWANLAFLTYERMVLFHCTFVALKAHDGTGSIRAAQYDSLMGETELFGGKIEDDGFLHALRIYRDRPSGGLRLQASVLRGELKGTPVWTAFVAQYIGATEWLKVVRPTIIHLRDLHPYVFSPDYTPQRGPRGEHELKFRTAQDAAEFRAAFSGIKRT